MAQHRVCPWWVGYLLACPIRRFAQDPAKILAPHIHSGMTVVEPGPGMGFFTIELARRVGASGRVIAVDIQRKMLDRLKRRLAKAGLAERVDARLAQQESLGLAEETGAIDFILAFAVVHELPSAPAFFEQAARLLKRGAKLLLAEPAGHVKAADFALELQQAEAAGLRLVDHPAIPRSHAAVLERL